AQLSDSLVDLAGLGLNMTVVANADILTELAFGPMPVDSATISDTWHIFLLTNSGSGVSDAWIDSVQFLKDGIAQVNASGANQMSYVRNWTQTALDTTASYTNLTSHTVLGATATDQVYGVVNGQFTMDRTDVTKSNGETTVRTLSLAGAMTNFTVERYSNWHSGCPTTGTFTIEATLTVTPSAGSPIVSTWMFDISLVNGRALITTTESGVSFVASADLCTM
ncbi:MAG: hypothetical protein HY851_00585, partial [candidate division Zixibacteria bacterium]|nr:hypothetical protein [candidate division Zixibacteria bacterium]